MQLTRDRWIPYYFVAFFIALALVDGIMVTLAIRSHTGTVMEHPYEAGLAYNRIIAAAKAQQALGWKSHLELVQSAPNKATVIFSLTDYQDQPLEAEEIRVNIVRPVQDGHDFDAFLRRIGDQYRATVIFPMPGLWELRVSVRAEGQSYQQIKRVVIE